MPGRKRNGRPLGEVVHIASLQTAFRPILLVTGEMWKESTRCG
jgi:hypothetical protein